MKIHCNFSILIYNLNLEEKTKKQRWHVWSPAENGGVLWPGKGSCHWQLAIIAHWQRDGEQLPGRGGTSWARRSGLLGLCRGEFLILQPLLCRVGFFLYFHQVEQCSGIQDCFCELAPVSFSSHMCNLHRTHNFCWFSQIFLPFSIKKLRFAINSLESHL